jgi:rod shape-determining protein MreC
MRNSRRSRITAAVLLVVALSFAVLGLQGGAVGSLKHGAAGVFGPVERGFHGFFSPIGRFFSGLTSINSRDRELARLRDEVTGLNQRIANGGYAANRAAELDKMLRVAALGRYTVVPAQVVAVNIGQDLAWTNTLDAGSRDGIKFDETVLDGDGLVGRVTSVSGTSCTVVLLADATSSVGSRLAGTMEIGVTSGDGLHPRALSMQLFDPFADVKVGERIVTVGSANYRPFVPGVPIGTVISVQGVRGQSGRLAIVLPFVDVFRLDLVGVVVDPPRTDPRDHVLPTPIATPTVTVTVTASPGGTSSSAAPSTTPSATPSGG